ncbi:MAG: HlyD family efflux transporter periplasmic adaptor subunit [Bacteroidota bacterium]
MADNNLQQLELRSEEVQEILTKMPHWMIRWGSVLWLILILLLLLISYLVKYPDIIPSEAIITTQIPPQKEYAQTTGKIEAILVKDQQEVRRNDPLAILENTANHQDVYYLKSILDTLVVNGQSFHFPMDDLPMLFLGSIESQYALFENSYFQYQLNKELQPFSNEALANRYSISELKGRLRALRSQREINETELAFKEKDLRRQQRLFEDGIIAAQEYENHQLQYAQAARSYKNFEASISQLKETLYNTQISSKSMEINKVKEEMALLKGVIQSFNQLKKAVKDWERLYVLTARTDGTVSFLNYWNANQTVNQGDLVFTIVPKENSSFVAKLKTPAQNSGKIKLGQQVNIKLENYPDSEFGVLNGTVKNISLLPDEAGLYIIDVDLPEELITSYLKPIDFTPEMRGVAEIITEDLRLIERFFYQFREVLQR